MKKKFAFLVHLRSYRQDLKLVSPVFGQIPERVYETLMKNRPLQPRIWTEVTITPNATEPDGYLILVPYSGKQMLQQSRQMIPIIQKSIDLAAKKGAEIVGLGALTSPVTLGGRMLENETSLPITNGNAYTAVITFQRIEKFIKENPAAAEIALVGATGSVGSLVAQLMANHHPEIKINLVARNERKLQMLADKMSLIDEDVKVRSSIGMESLQTADLVVLLTSSHECLLRSEHLQKGATVLDVTQPRNVKEALLRERPDVTIIDGGLVRLPHLKFSQRGIGLPDQLSFACLAETMLLAQAGYDQNFAVGEPTLAQGEYILQLAEQFRHMGFGLAEDHSFGKPLPAAPKLLPIFKPHEDAPIF